MHDRGVDHQVVVDELRRPPGVGPDAADGAGDEKDVLRPMRVEPAIHRRLVAQVELVAAGGQQVAEALGSQPAGDRRTHQPAVAGDVDAGIDRNLALAHRARKC